MRINSGYSLELKNLTLTNFNSTENGGVILNNYGEVTINKCQIKGNIAQNGGAIYNNYGSLTIINTTRRNNTAKEDGWAIYNRYIREETVINSNIPKRIVMINLNSNVSITKSTEKDEEIKIGVNYKENQTVDFANKTKEDIEVIIPIKITKNSTGTITLNETVTFTLNLNDIKKQFTVNFKVNNYTVILVLFNVTLL